VIRLPSMRADGPFASVLSNAVPSIASGGQRHPMRSLSGSGRKSIAPVDRMSVGRGFRHAFLRAMASSGLISGIVQRLMSPWSSSVGLWRLANWRCTLATIPRAAIQLISRQAQYSITPRTCSQRTAMRFEETSIGRAFTPSASCAASVIGDPFDGVVPSGVRWTMGLCPVSVTLLRVPR
jgi:hypothetical protein